MGVHLGRPESFGRSWVPPIGNDPSCTLLQFVFVWGFVQYWGLPLGLHWCGVVALASGFRVVSLRIREVLSCAFLSGGGGGGCGVCVTI